MSQHRFNTAHKQRQICVYAGWDRPLQGCFMFIEYSDRDSGEMLYSNLDEVDCHPPTFDKFQRVLDGYEISLPEEMVQAIQADIASDRGNSIKDWTTVGKGQ